MKRALILQLMALVLLLLIGVFQTTSCEVKTRASNDPISGEAIFASQAQNNLNTGRSIGGGEKGKNQRNEHQNSSSMSLVKEFLEVMGPGLLPLPLILLLIPLAIHGLPLAFLAEQYYEAQHKEKESMQEEQKTPVKEKLWEWNDVIETSLGDMTVGIKFRVGEALQENEVPKSVFRLRYFDKDEPEKEKDVILWEEPPLAFLDSSTEALGVDNKVETELDETNAKLNPSLGASADNDAVKGGKGKGKGRWNKNSLV